MKMTFRWYGESDSIPLEYIKQIPGMSGVVTAVYDVPVGEVWSTDKIARLKELCDNKELEMEVIESVPVHEDIKLGKPSRDGLIKNYAQTIRNLGKFGVKCICYNFMPVSSHAGIMPLRKYTRFSNSFSCVIPLYSASKPFSCSPV